MRGKGYRRRRKSSPVTGSLSARELYVSVGWPTLKPPGDGTDTAVFAPDTDSHGVSGRCSIPAITAHPAACIAASLLVLHDIAREPLLT